MDERTISQLSTIRYTQTPAGKTKIESKEDARKRGVKSPDRAEAVMLAYAHATPGIIEFYRELVGQGGRDAPTEISSVPLSASR